MMDYKSLNTSKELIFAVSDLKEGFEKEFFDSLQLYEDLLPYLLIYDRPLKYLHDPHTVLEPEAILSFALKYKNTTKPHLRSENLEQTRAYFP